MSNPNKPVAKIGFPVTASIWRNEKEGRAYYTTTFQFSYKDETGQWKHTNAFNVDELLPLAKIADLAHTEACKLRTAERRAQASDAPSDE